MTVRWGTFHGDVHAGNVMLLRDGRDRLGHRWSTRSRHAQVLCPIARRRSR
jgi:predicted unusual protein kinase regulating ubiquinone biosynthesis (AarF/ABC1/UbiB family)